MDPKNNDGVVLFAFWTFIILYFVLSSRGGC